MALFWASKEERDEINRLIEEGGLSEARRKIEGYDRLEQPVAGLLAAYNTSKLGEPTEEPNEAISFVASSLDDLVKDRRELDATKAIIEGVVGKELNLSSTRGRNTLNNYLQFGAAVATEMTEITQGFHSIGASADQVWGSYRNLIAGVSEEVPSAKLAEYIKENSDLESKLEQLPAEAATTLRTQVAGQKYTTLDEAKIRINDQISVVLAEPTNIAITNKSFPLAINEGLEIAKVIPTLTASINSAIKSYVRTISETDVQETYKDNFSEFAVDLSEAADGINFFGEHTTTVANAIGGRLYSMVTKLAGEPSNWDRSQQVETIKYLGQAKKGLTVNKVYNMPKDFEGLLYDAARNLATIETQDYLAQIDRTRLTMAKVMKAQNLALRKFDAEQPELNISDFVADTDKEAWNKVTEVYSDIAKDTELKLDELMEPLQAQYGILMEASK